MAAFSSTAFSTDAFSISAFDFDNTPAVATAVPTRPDKERYSYHPQTIAEKRAELKGIDNEIAEAEKRREATRKRLAAKHLAENAAKRLAAQERKLLEEINALSIERLRLIRMIDDDEAILVLMMSRPFH